MASRAARLDLSAYFIHAIEVALTSRMNAPSAKMLENRL
jgi:hypothetical protein